MPTTSTTAVADHRARSTRPDLSSSRFGPSERSPLVAVAVAMAVAGGILANADVIGVPWMLLLYCAFAVYEEVRSFDVPVPWSATALTLHLAGVVYTEDLALFAGSVAGAALAPILLLPLCANGFVRTGTLWGGAAIGAVVGIHNMPAILLLAAGAAIPLVLSRVLVDANTRTVPIVSVIAIAAAIHPLF